MTTIDTPDWLIKGGTAYVLTYSHQAGIGSYASAERVTIKSIAATQVMIEDRNGEVRRVRRKDMTLPRTGGRWTGDDELVGPGDLRVRRSTVEGNIAEWGRAYRSKVETSLRRVVTGRARVADDPVAVGREAVAAFEEIKREAQRAIDNLKAALDLIT